ncbi:MAG: hypothetical protein U0Q18_19210 [Bryobacteraceae bacterium]
MLTIRSAQFQAFEESVRQAFLDRVLAAVFRLLPELPEQAAPEALRAFVERASRRAGDHGFETERDIYTYVALSAVFGEGALEQHPFAGPVLADRSLQGQTKSERLLAAVEMRPAGVLRASGA